jgi:hypothetical protein
MAGLPLKSRREGFRSDVTIHGHIDIRAVARMRLSPPGIATLIFSRLVVGYGNYLKGVVGK